MALACESLLTLFVGDEKNAIDLIRIERNIFLCIGVAAGRRVMHTRSYLLYKPVMACPISALETVKMMWLFLVYAIFDFYLNDIVRFFAAVVGTPSPTGSPGRPNACSCNEKLGSTTHRNFTKSSAAHRD